MYGKAHVAFETIVSTSTSKFINGKLEDFKLEEVSESIDEFGSVTKSSKGYIQSITLPNQSASHMKLMPAPSKPR